MASGDIKLAWGSSVALTISPQNVATSSTLLAGVESDAVTTGASVIDYLLSGKWRAGTSPTVDTFVEVWVYASMNDTPLYPDVFDGTASAETVTSVNVKNAALKLAAVIRLDNTTGRDYFVVGISIAQLFGGVLPKQWGIFITHSSAVNSDTTAGNHAWYYTPVYATVTP